MINREKVVTNKNTSCNHVDGESVERCVIELCPELHRGRRGCSHARQICVSVQAQLTESVGLQGAVGAGPDIDLHRVSALFHSLIIRAGLDVKDHSCLKATALVSKAMAL